MSNNSNLIPFLPSDICTENDNDIVCLNKLKNYKCEDLKKSISKTISSKTPSDIQNIKTDINHLSSLSTIFNEITENVNNILENTKCIVDEINSNTTLNLNDNEKIEPFDINDIKYHFIKTFIDDDKELKKKIFNNFGGNNLRMINIYTIIIIIIFTFIFLYFLNK